MRKRFRDFALEVYFSTWEFTARYNLTGSDAENWRLPEILAMASQEDLADFDTIGLGYTEVYGAPALRNAIAATYGTVTPEHLMTFAGAQEAIYVVHQVLLEETDHVIVVTPNYQSAESIPLTICDVTGVALDIDRNWALDVDQIARAIRPNTKLISINFPNNPTGAIIPRASLDAIVELCRTHGIWLFSDEVYRLIERDPASRLPQAVDLYERAISLNVMSKAYGLPGLRVGWVACKDRWMLGRFERYKHYLSICNSAPSEVLARIALKNADKILARNREIVEQNVGHLAQFFGEHRDLFDWRQPDGGCVGFIRYTGADGVEAFTKRLVEEASVLFLPSSIYRSELGPVPQDCMRVGFGHRNLPEGLTALRNWMKRNTA